MFRTEFKITRYLFFLAVFFSSATAQPEEGKVVCRRSGTNFRTAVPSQTLTINQAGVDMVYYRIDLVIDPSTETIQGQVLATGIILDSTISTFDLDLASNLTVDSVFYGENQLFYTHSNDLLQISLPDTINTGQKISILIIYHGHPVPSGLGSFRFDSYNDKPMIWSLSEPYGARIWWPCKDAPVDKADSVDINITVPIVPDTLIVASNGVLTHIDYEGDLATYHWKSRYPIATYLVSVAIYPYKMFYDWFVYGESDSMRLEYYVYPDHYNIGQLVDNYLMTKDMLTAFSARFGLYPFINEKYGHAEFERGGGMEHQTLSSLSGYSESLIAHELAHQWWGDLVTCEDFHHIWINEGFATYSQAMWSELRDNSIESLHAEMANKVYYGDGTIYVEDSTDLALIFNSNRSYNKAAWVLHMLRHVVGDSTFFEILQTFAGDPAFRFGTATTEQFRDLCESVSGMDLHPFFDQWIYQTYFPVYDVGYIQLGDSLQVTIDQFSEGGTIFDMPVDLKIICTDTVVATVVWNSQASQVYLIPLPTGQSVVDLELDPDNWILKDVRFIYVGTEKPTIPKTFQLSPAYPNPFNAMVTIPYKIHSKGKTTIKIINLAGRVVWTDSWHTDIGKHTMTWNGKDNHGQNVSSGVYFISMNFDDVVLSRKLLLLR